MFNLRFCGMWLLCVSCSIATAGVKLGRTAEPDDSRPAPEHQFTTSYTYYDEAPLDGLVKTRTDAAGRVTRYAYTPQGQLAKVTFADGRTVEYVYDKLGRRVAMKDAAGTTRYRYDSLNQLVRVDQANGLWVEFEYDWQGRITAVVMPAGAAEGGKAGARSARGPYEAEGEEGWRVEYAHDLAGRIARIDSPVGTFTWTYDAAEGTVTRRMPNGVVSTFFHLPDGLLQRIRHEREAAGDGRGSPGRELLVEFSYTYHPGGRAASETVTTPAGSETTHYEYDRLGRLTAARLPGGGTLAYEYDAMGNRLKRTGPEGEAQYEYDRWDRILRAGEATFGHDPAGNVAWRDGPDGRQDYTYDCTNRLVASRGPDVEVRYTYCGDGYLVGRSASGAATDYLVMPHSDENRVLAERRADGRIVHTIHGERTLCRALGRSALYYLEDRLGSVRLVTRADGRSGELVGYTPFGTSESLGGGRGVAPGFTGLPHDRASGLVLTRFRAYAPELGAFLQQEPKRRLPLGSPEDMSLYAYCGADPVNFTDRDGCRRRRRSRVGDYGELHYDGASVPIYFDPEEGTLWFPRSLKIAAHNILPTFLRDKAMGLGLRRVAGETGKKFNKVAQAGKGGGNVLGGFIATLQIGEIAERIANTIEGAESRNQRFGLVGSYVIYIPELQRKDPQQVRRFLEPLLKQGMWPPRKLIQRMYEREILEPPDTGRGAGSRGLGDDQSRYLSPPNGGGGGFGRGGMGDTYERLRKHNLYLQFYPFIDGLGDDHRRYWVPPPPPPPPPPPSVEFDWGDDQRRYFRPPPPWDQSPMLKWLGDDQSRYFPPPPDNGGGGGGFGGGFGTDPMKIGGVRLDRAARVLGELGRIAGLRFDPQSGRLVLLAEQTEAALPAMRLEDLAAVMYSIYVEGTDPTLSIDPKPGDLLGPKMDVVYSPGLRFTHAGRVMYLTDYRLKEMAAGVGEARRGAGALPDDFKCLARLEQELFPEGREPQRRVWYRFWLVPDDITLTVAEDGRSLVFQPAAIRVETENMVLTDGRLERVEDVRDPVAEAFARQCTERYDELAEAFPVFEELRQLAQIVGLVKWMHEQGIEVDLGWVERYRSSGATTPLECDSVRAEVPVRDGSGTLAGERMQFFFGGVVMSPAVKTRRLPAPRPEGRQSLDEVRDRRAIERLAALMESVAAGPDEESWDLVGGAGRGVVVPGVARRLLGGYQARQVDLAVRDGRQEVVLARHYNSLMNEPTALGYGWSLLLPRLLRRQPLGGEARVVPPGGPADGPALPTYLLTDDFGTFELTFRPDPAAAERGVVRYDSAGGADGVRQFLVLPRGEGFRLVFDDGRDWRFDAEGHLVEQRRRDHRIVYRYQPSSGSRRLQSIVRADEGSSPIGVSLSYDEQGRIVLAEGSDGSEVRYAYDTAGNLAEAAGPEGAFAYSYDANRLLTETALDGETMATARYDGEGRLVGLSGASGDEHSRFEFAPTEAGGLAVAESIAGRRLIYDADLRLVGIEEPGGRASLEYYADGRPRKALYTDDSGLESVVNYSEQGDWIEWQTPTGAAVAMSFDPAEGISRLELNGRELGRRQYDPDRGQEVVTLPTHTIRRQFRDDRLVRESVTVPGAGPTAESFELEYEGGRPLRLSGAGGMSAQWQYEEDRLVAIETPRQTLRLLEGDGGFEATGRDGSRRGVSRTVADDEERIVEQWDDARRQTTVREGRLAEVREYDGGTTRYEWDAGEGLLTGVTDATGSRIAYRYERREAEDDSAGHLLAAVTFPNGRTMAFVYDEAGRVTKIRE